MFARGDSVCCCDAAGSDSRFLMNDIMQRSVSVAAAAQQQADDKTDAQSAQH